MTIDDKGQIIFDLQDFLERMDGGIKRDLVKTLGCQSSVIKDVADQIVDGMTEDGSYGPKSCTIYSDPRDGLDYAIRRIAKASSEVAKTEIERLETQLKKLEIENQRLRDELYARSRNY